MPDELAYYEYKYLIEAQKIHLCRMVLDGMYAGTDLFPRGWLETIYYDTPHATCYEECLNGTNPKMKFRVRRYEDTQVVQGQIKEKRIYGVRKWKARLFPHSDKFPPWSYLGELAEDNFKPLHALSLSYGYLVPVVHIRYLRHRYRYPGYRINMDEKIQAVPCHGLPWRAKSFVQASFALLEVKTASEHPRLPFLGLLQLKPVAFSKFFFSLRLLRHEADAAGKYI